MTPVPPHFPKAADPAVEDIARRAHALPTDQKLLVAAALVVKGGDYLLVAEPLVECALSEIRLRQIAGSGK